MHFEERIRAGVPRTQAWAFLWRTQQLATCLPGCLGVEEVAPGRTYKVRFEDRVGPYKVHFDMDVSVEEARDGEYIGLRGQGRDKMLGASLRLALGVRLEPIGDQETDLVVIADVEVLGRIATLGEFVIKRKANEVVNRFAQNIQAELRKGA